MDGARQVVSGLAVGETVITDPPPQLKDGAAVKTDSGNFVYDCAFGAIKDASALAAALSAVPGIVEHGLFVGLATTLVIAHPGEVEIIPPSR